MPTGEGDNSGRHLEASLDEEIGARLNDEFGLVQRSREVDEHELMIDDLVREQTRGLPTGYRGKFYGARELCLNFVNIIMLLFFLLC